MIEALSSGIQLLRQFSSWLRDRDKNDLHPFYEADVINEAKKYFVETHCQDKAPHDHLELHEAPNSAVREPLIKYMFRAFRSESDRYFMILAGAGMGKTTFMINLFLKYRSQVNPKYAIVLIPLGDPEANEEIIRLSKDKEKARNTILLLDAFDEDPLAQSNYEERLQNILNTTRFFRKLVLTCRTQFFPNEDAEDYDIQIEKQGGFGSYRFLKKYVSPFTDDDVESFLKKRFPFFKQRKEARAIVDQSYSLMSRPLLLSWVHLLIESKEPFRQRSEIYQTLCRKWVERESLKQLGSLKESGRTPEYFRGQMWRFLMATARYTHRRERMRKGTKIPISNVKDIAIRLGIELKEIDVTSRSLLNRDPGGLFKFSHKSIYEYLAAKYEVDLAIDSVRRSTRLTTNLMKSFFTEMADDMVFKSPKKARRTYFVVQSGFELVLYLQALLEYGSSDLINYVTSRAHYLRHSKKWYLLTDDGETANLVILQEQFMESKPSRRLLDIVDWRLTNYRSETFFRLPGK